LLIVPLAVHTGKVTSATAPVFPSAVHTGSVTDARAIV
jgi:hypothetical protein